MSRTQSYKEKFSVDLRHAGILGLWLAENGHETFICQWECSNSSVAYFYAEIFFIGSGPGCRRICCSRSWRPSLVFFLIVAAIRGSNDHLPRFNDQKYHFRFFFLIFRFSSSSSLLCCYFFSLFLKNLFFKLMLIFAIVGQVWPDAEISVISGIAKELRTQYWMIFKLFEM